MELLLSLLMIGSIASIPLLHIPLEITLHVLQPPGLPDPPLPLPVLILVAQPRKLQTSAFLLLISLLAQTIQFHFDQVYILPPEGKLVGVQLFTIYYLLQFLLLLLEDFYLVELGLQLLEFRNSLLGQHFAITTGIPIRGAFITIFIMVPISIRTLHMQFHFQFVVVEQAIHLASRILHDVKWTVVVLGPVSRRELGLRGTFVGVRRVGLLWHLEAVVLLLVCESSQTFGCVADITILFVPVAASIHPYLGQKTPLATLPIFESLSPALTPSSPVPLFFSLLLPAMNIIGFPISKVKRVGFLLPLRLRRMIEDIFGID